MAVLCVLAGDGTERVVEVHALRGSEVRIGRAADSHISLADPSVSREHAILKHDGYTWHVTNVSSANTLSIGGHRVTAAPLDPGTVFVLGTVRLRFEPEDPRQRPTVVPQQAAPSPPPRRAPLPVPPKTTRPPRASAWPIILSVVGLALGAAMLLARVELARWSLTQWPQLASVLPL